MTQTTLDDYQFLAARTDKGSELPYYILGLVGEAGEIANIYKRVIRDNLTQEDEAFAKYHGQIIDELGDVLWYVAIMAKHLGVTLDTVANLNLEKLQLRHRGHQFNPETADAHRS